MALQMQGVGKRYPGTLAVDNVDLEVYSGEVHALVGENGASKSTLMNILAGTFGDYTGGVLVGGKEARLDSPAAARTGARSTGGRLARIWGNLPASGERKGREGTCLARGAATPLR